MAARVSRRLVEVLSFWAGLGLAPLARAQDPTYVQGSVLAAETNTPLLAAVVTSSRAGRSTTTDRLGRFVLWLEAFPDTLVARLIGRMPDTVVVESASARGVVILLVSAPSRLTDLTVTAPAATIGGEGIASLGSWQLSMSAIRAIPPAIETDVFRALTLLPSVSFSSPLSARPLIRGYDASESSLRIDGHEVLNLYHIGRAFSAFPADAAQQVSVTGSPPPVSEGGTLAGVVDITGRGGAAEGLEGGVDLSLVSAAGWAGFASPFHGFAAARIVHLESIGAVSSQDVPYGFQDFYAGAVIPGRNGPRGRITAFASRDHLLDRDIGSGMDWSNLLLGTRWNLASEGSTGISLLGSVTRFSEDVREIAARQSRIDVTNRFTRLSTGLELSTGGPTSRLVVGSGLGLRRVFNQIVPLSGNDFPLTDLGVSRLEWSGYAAWTRNLGDAAVQLGARVDGAGSVHVIQPRVRLHLPLRSDMSLALGAGRTGRTFHLVSDPQAEPDLAFYDFWLSAGEDGVPIPRSDHLSLDLDGEHGSFAWRLSGYLSKATGLVELRPASEPVAAGANQFRFGRGRTRGVELQVGLRSRENRESSFSVLYALSRSERNWNDLWIPWSQEHLHLLRALGFLKLSRRWSVFAAFEAASGIPLTPVDQVLFINDQGGTDSTLGFPTFRYGPENSVRGLGTARADLGARFEFKGLGRSRASLGLSVINIGFGPVAPVTPLSPGFEPGAPGQPDLVRVSYDRLFNLPAIPTVTLRMEF